MMMRLIIFVVIGALTGSRPAIAEITALTNARLIDGLGNPVVKSATILMNGETIVAAGRAKNVAVPDGALVIDLEGKTVMPGLADMHVHLLGGWDGLSVDMLGYQNYLNALLYAGVTTIMDVGNVEPYILQIRDEIERGTLVGPRIYATGSLVDGADPFWPPIAVAMASTAQAEKIVSDKAVAKVDAIKAYAGLSVPQLSALVKAADKRGLKVIVDLWNQNGAYDVAATGMHAFAHVPNRPMDPQALEYVAKNDVIVITTNAVKETFARRRLDDLSFLDHPIVADTIIPAFDQALRDYAVRELSEDEAAVKARYQQNLKNSLENTRRLKNAGVTLVAGTDAPYPGTLYGEGLHRELELFVEAGYTPLEAIKAATSDAAKLIGADDWGVIAPGKRADLVVVSGKPDQNVGDTRSIMMVFQKGELVDRAALKFDPAKNLNFSVSAPVNGAGYLPHPHD